MVTTSRRRFPWRRMLKEVGRGFLQAIGILRMRRLPPDAYWVRDPWGRWELRVPARSWEGPFA